MYVCGHIIGDQETLKGAVCESRERISTCHSHHVCFLLQAVFLVLKDQCDNVVPKWMLTDMALDEWNAATTAYPGLDHRYSE